MNPIANIGSNIQLKTTDLQKDVLSLRDMKTRLLNSFSVIWDLENTQISLILERILSFEQRILDLDNNRMWHEKELKKLEIKNLSFKLESTEKWLEETKWFV